MRNSWAVSNLSSEFLCVKQTKTRLVTLIKDNNLCQLIVQHTVIAERYRYVCRKRCDFLFI